MRTTLTIDDRIAAELKRIAHESAKSYKTVVNETLRAGLRASGATSKSKAYRLKPASLGEPSAGYDLTKALALAAHLEDGDVIRKLAARK